MNAQERVNKAFAYIALREPFYAAVVGRLPKQVLNDGITAATDGTRILFGESFVDSLNDGQLLGLCLHESMHVILMHSWRREGRDHRLWNVATDAAINRLILDSGYSLPDDGVVLPWVTSDMSAEEIYARLQQESDGQDDSQGGDNVQDKNGEGQPQGGFGGQGDLMDAPDGTKAADMEATIRAAAQAARNAGVSSALLDRVLGMMSQPRVDWREALRALLVSASRDDFSYRRFSKRYMHRGLYLPALYSEKMGGLVIGFDTSGSVTQHMADQIAAEIQAIVDDTRPDWVEVIYCDAAVTGVQRFEMGETITLAPKGGGGTRFKPAIDKAAEIGQNERVAAMVYFTDMEGNISECEEPPFPVLWGCVGAHAYEPPFGSVVLVNLES